MVRIKPAINEVVDALEENIEKMVDVGKDGIVGDIKDDTHRLREKGLAQKLKQNMDETEFGFWNADVTFEMLLF